MKIVVVSPHRDDAAFSLGLSIEAWTAASHSVTVLNCFTQSSYAPFSDVEALHPNDRVSFVTAIRRKEDVAWGKLLGGRVHFHDLDLLDAPLRLACPADEVLTMSIRPGDRAVARVAGALAKLAAKASPNELAVLVPWALGGHIDHRVVHEAALQAFAEHPVPLALYEDLPYATWNGAAEELQERSAHSVLEVQPAFACPPAPEAETAVERKARMADRYDSQIDSGTVRSIAEFARIYGGRERLWANPAFLNTGLAHNERGPQ